jgi:hypothetical protein
MASQKFLNCRVGVSQARLPARHAFVGIAKKRDTDAGKTLYILKPEWRMGSVSVLLHFYYVGAFCLAIFPDILVQDHQLKVGQ